MAGQPEMKENSGSFAPNLRCIHHKAVFAVLFLVGLALHSPHVLAA
jgi:hypothetical protein